VIEATFAVPGDLGTPTGGYAYARRLLTEAENAGMTLAHAALPGGFPRPTLEAMADTALLLARLPVGRPVLIDGLALGVLPADVLAALPGPLVALCHHPLALETGVGEAEARKLRESERAALAASAAVIATSATTARTLVADYGVPESRLTVALPGTDAAERAHGSGGTGVAILSVGSLTPRKGHDVLITALAGVAHLDWHLTIAGPVDLDPAHAAALEERITATGIEARITLAGALDTAALDRAYARSDLFVLASRYEGFGMAYREAMARGLPVLGCAGGAVAEATCGAAELVSPGDVAALRLALARLIGDPAARTRLAEDCWQAAQGFARWRDTAAVVAGVLRGVAQ
jgi:hypothetical protein